MTRILSGTATVVAGDRSVTFSGPPLSDANCPVDGTVVLGGAAYFIASRVDTSHFELTRDFEGTDGVVSCEIDPLNANAINLVRVARQITEYDARTRLLEADGKGLFYSVLGQTGANDPGPGKVARDAAAWPDATELYLDVLDAGGVDATPIIDLWGASSIVIVRSLASRAYASYRLAASPLDQGPGEWRKLADLEYLGGDGMLADGEDVAIEWRLAGADRDFDAQVANVAGRAAYDGEGQGFRVLVSDVGDGRAGIYSKASNASADWVGPAYKTGADGPPGPYTGLTFGPTTTLPAGSAASVIVTDISPGVVRLDFNVPKGADGSGTGDTTGPAGSTAGNPVIFAGTSGKVLAEGAFASQAEALAGANAAKFMTPLGTRQALGGLIRRLQVFTASGTYTPHPKMVLCEIECVGGGGGGGGAAISGSNNQTVGGGGGGAEYAFKLAKAADIGASKAVTIGAGGSAGPTNGSGGAGGQTSLGALCIAKGGSGGNFATAGTSGAPAAGGTGGTGDLLVRGGYGLGGPYNNAQTIVAGIRTGGNAPRGLGEGGHTVPNAAGNIGLGYGSGGGGGYDWNNTGAKGGGAGASGVVIITEFCTE